jgi:heme-degrading monooxygenase HmoA
MQTHGQPKAEEARLGEAVGERTGQARAVGDGGRFIVINAVHCRADFRERFEELFRTRAGLVEQMPGFCALMVLRPRASEEPYLVVTVWESEEHFRAWQRSEAFRKGHERAMAIVEHARQAGQEPPMRSEVQLYEVLLAVAAQG